MAVAPASRQIYATVTVRGLLLVYQKPSEAVAIMSGFIDIAENVYRSSWFNETEAFNSVLASSYNSWRSGGNPFYPDVHLAVACSVGWEGWNSRSNSLRLSCFSRRSYDSTSPRIGGSAYCNFFINDTSLYNITCYPRKFDRLPHTFRN